MELASFALATVFSFLAVWDMAYPSHAKMRTLLVLIAIIIAWVAYRPVSQLIAYFCVGLALGGTTGGLVMFAVRNFKTKPTQSIKDFD